MKPHQQQARRQPGVDGAPCGSAGVFEQRLGVGEVPAKGRDLGELRPRERLAVRIADREIGLQCGAGVLARGVELCEVDRLAGLGRTQPSDPRRTGVRADQATQPFEAPRFCVTVAGFLRELCATQRRRPAQFVVVEHVGGGVQPIERGGTRGVGAVAGGDRLLHQQQVGADARVVSRRETSLDRALGVVDRTHREGPPAGGGIVGRRRGVIAGQIVLARDRPRQLAGLVTAEIVQRARDAAVTRRRTLRLGVGGDGPRDEVMGERVIEETAAGRFLDDAMLDQFVDRRLDRSLGPTAHVDQRVAREPRAHQRGDLRDRARLARPLLDASGQQALRAQGGPRGQLLDRGVDELGEEERVADRGREQRRDLAFHRRNRAPEVGEVDLRERGEGDPADDAFGVRAAAQPAQWMRAGRLVVAIGDQQEDGLQQQPP